MARARKFVTAQQQEKDTEREKEWARVAGERVDILKSQPATQFAMKNKCRADF